MPNWVETRVSLYGPKDVIREWAELSVRGYEINESTEDQKVDAAAQAISVMEPKVVRKGEFSFGGFTGVPDDYATNWYKQGLDLWGTKWDCVDVNTGVAFGEDAPGSDLLESVETVLEDQADGETAYFSLQWDTAWSPAIPYLESVVRRFPDLTITATYVDECLNFVGTVTVSEEGTIVQDYDTPSDYNSLLPFPTTAPSQDAPEEAWDQYYEKMQEWELGIHAALEELA